MSLANLQVLQDSPTDPNSAFKLKRFAILKWLEGNVPTPYFDTKGIITIGIGFNIDTITGNRNRVMGGDGMNLSLAQQAAITAAWNSPVMKQIRALPQATPTQLWAKNAELCAYLDSVLGGGLSFSMTDPQIQSVFNVLVLEHQNKISSLVGTPSIEQIVLTSLSYNGMVGPGLTAAINMTDPSEARAEAWFQIRYDHNELKGSASHYFWSQHATSPTH